jgi:tetratricopeptide (TPR) repeat protein
MATQAQTDFEKAESLFLQQKYTLAQPLFEQFLTQNPGNLKTIELLGDLHGSLKHWDKAIFYYEKLKNLKPSQANYYYKYGGVLGMKAKESNKFKALAMIGDVKSAFEKAIALNPKHIEARFALIELYIQLPAIVGGSEGKAARYAEELSKISAVDGYLAKGRISEYYNRFIDAEKQYLAAFKIGKSVTTYKKLFDLYKNKMHQPEKALLLKKEFEKKT